MLLSICDVHATVYLRRRPHQMITAYRIGNVNWRFLRVTLIGNQMGGIAQLWVWIANRARRDMTYLPYWCGFEVINNGNHFNHARGNLHIYLHNVVCLSVGQSVRMSKTRLLEVPWVSAHIGDFASLWWRGCLCVIQGCREFLVKWKGYTSK